MRNGALSSSGGSQPISLAARASSAIPFFFEPVLWRGACSGTSTRDASCCCHPLTGIPYLRPGPRRQSTLGRWGGAEDRGGAATMLGGIPPVQTSSFPHPNSTVAVVAMALMCLGRWPVTSHWMRSTARTTKRLAATTSTPSGCTVRLGRPCWPSNSAPTSGLWGRPSSKPGQPRRRAVGSLPLDLS